MFSSSPMSIMILSLQLLGSIPTAQAGTWAAPAALSPQIDGVCPNWASINCQSISEPNYCCDEGYYCAYGGEDNHIGCCPNDETCDGTPPTATTTVYATTETVAATTYTEILDGTTVYVAGGTTEYVGATTTEYVYGTSATTICSTLTERDAAGLPTTAAGACGVILIVNGAGRGAEGLALSAMLGVANIMMALGAGLGLI